MKFQERKKKETLVQTTSVYMAADPCVKFVVLPGRDSHSLNN